MLPKQGVPTAQRLASPAAPLNWEELSPQLVPNHQPVFSIAMFDYERVVWHVNFFNVFLDFVGANHGCLRRPAMSCWQSAWASSATLHHPTRRPELLNPEASSRWVSAHVHRKWPSVAGYGCFRWFSIWQRKLFVGPFWVMLNLAILLQLPSGELT